MLQNPRSAALQEFVSESLGVEGLQFKTSHLQILLVTLADGKALSNIVVDCALGSAEFPEATELGKPK